MTRILLTGASGFVATHILDLLLSHGHSVRITVRTDSKAQALLSAHQSFVSAGKLDYVLLSDIAAPGAFDNALNTQEGSQPITAVIHTASPFPPQIVPDVQRDLLDPAVKGTTNLLSAVHEHAPAVTRVVVTSSFAAIIDPARGNGRGYTYSESDWNPVTRQDALDNPAAGYRASKTLAEKAAWDFVAVHKPRFTLATINPPLVIGPIKPYAASLDTINTSNERTLHMLQGKMKPALAPTGAYLWVDVRDVAAAHVAAAERTAAGGKRFFVVEGRFSNQEIADIIKSEFLDEAFAQRLPEARENDDGYPDGGKENVYAADNARSKEVLGLEYRGLKESIVDLVNSLKELGVN